MKYLSTLLLFLAPTVYGEEITYAPPETMGTPPADITPEISGMVVSRNNEDAVWVHNDSGDGPLMYALSLSTGDLLAVAELPDASSKDCEDMAMGPGPDKRFDYLYLADMGNNQREKKQLWIHRTPALSVVARPNFAPPRAVAKHMETFVFTYPNPEVAVFDAETLLVDPENGEITIVTKDHNENDGVSFIFRSDGALSSTKPNRLTLVGEMFFGKGARNRVTGGDVSADGRWVIVRTYQQARLYRRDPDQRVAEALLGEYTTINLAFEPQGEAIAFAPSKESDSSDAPTFYSATELGPKAINPERIMRPFSRYRPSPAN